MRKNILKIGIVLMIFTIIAMTMQIVEASSFDLNEIVSEDGNGSSLATPTPTAVPTATPTPTTAPTATATPTQATNTTLPKTGANENAIIGLMVVFVAIGIYTFKKSTDYNM